MMLTGTPVLRARRSESGLMSHAEFDETTTPYCAGLGYFVKLNDCDFIGKAALEKLISGSVPLACACAAV